jgi:hypothetical protein
MRGISFVTLALFIAACHHDVLESGMSPAPATLKCGGPQDCPGTTCCYTESPAAEGSHCYDPAADCLPGQAPCVCDVQGLDFSYRVVCNDSLDCANGKTCCPTTTAHSGQSILLCMDTCP